MIQRQFISTGIAVWLTLGWLAGETDDSLTRAQAESRLKQLKTEISVLKNTLERARSTLSDEQKALKLINLEIQTNTLKLRQQESVRLAHDEQLAALHKERSDYLHSLNNRRELLAQQIMAAYRLGRESRLKLVLNQDSPALLSRTLAYFDYFSYEDR